jgi:2-succinyl-6-hydroxy-2,4-cyclohexadiene-1-carboxylate synthase
MAPALVLLHGFTQTGASWEPVIAALGERYRPLAPDIRGHGAASAARPVTFEACVADVAALSPPRFALAGYSMGGRLALHVALALPERVERLVLVGATAGIEDPAERSARRASDEALAAELERSTIEAFAERWARQPVLAGQSEAVGRAAHADRLRNTPEGLAAALRGIGTGAMEPLWDRLAELEMTVSLLAGERDEKFRALAERMAQRLPHGEVVVIQGAGHAAHLEAPGAVAELL